MTGKTPAKRSGAALDKRPDFIPKETTGTEHIGASDIRLPRLAIAQKISNQLDKDQPEYIEGLGYKDMFNDVSERIYGPGPLDIAIVCAFPPRGIEFRPRSEGGGVLDMNVPLDDERMKWHGREKPKGTLFYDYIVYLIEHQETISMSMKNAGIKVAKHLNSLIIQRRAPVFAGQYTVRVENGKSPEGPFGIFAFNNNGWIENAEDYARMQELHDNYSKMRAEDVIKVDDKDADDETGRQPGDEDPGSDDIPF